MARRLFGADVTLTARAGGCVVASEAMVLASAGTLAMASAPEQLAALLGLILDEPGLPREALDATHIGAAIPDGPLFAVAERQDPAGGRTILVMTRMEWGFAGRGDVEIEAVEWSPPVFQQ